MRLWGRLALVMALGSVAPVVGVGALATRAATQRAETDSQARLRREAQLHGEVVGRWLRDQRSHAEAWTQVFPTQLSNLSDDLRSGFLAAVYRGTPAAVVVVLVDGDGRAVVAPVFALSGGDRVAADALRAQALIDRLPLTEAMESGSAIGGAWLPDGLGTIPSVPLAVLAASGATPEETLVLGIEVRVEAAAELANRSTPRHGVLLLGQNGDALVGAGHPLARPDLLRPLVETDADFRYGAADDEVLGSIVPVPWSRWSTTVLEPAIDVRRPATELRDNVVSTVVASASLAMVLAFVLAGTLSRPVERLRDAALALARGEAKARVDIGRSDELGELARAFDHMSEQLEQQRGAIEAFNIELQDRVAERTRELQEAHVELIHSGQLAAVAQIGAGLAHQLNNPLAAVLGLSQLLRARHRDEPLLEDLEAEAARCRDVVGVMLKLTSGEVDPGKAPVVDVLDVIQDVRRLVAGAFEQRGVALQLTDAGGEPLFARIDKGSAGRVLAQSLEAMRAGLDAGAMLRLAPTSLVDGQGASWVQIELAADQPVARGGARHDDRMASGFDLWVARQLLAQFGGRLDEASTDASTVWRLRLPRANP